MADTTQAVYLELAVRALENGDRPALAGALASLDPATLDHLAAVLAHPVWAGLANHYPQALAAMPLPRR
ncbi:hypothetical protein KGA66_03510 [Actinocrinis puniceicyclus]|uniref:Uncharacterized protein n=1 Tax=Actinocrinis puniceicyclus TaxID=977794 RepID=A0A8J7WH11_9ACTN|nr:hypothetical protein [Actinocrinis puniceicyclus]MBS2962101.1 hypothetical protein [Actinocrinis puniceicyclus]